MKATFLILGLTLGVISADPIVVGQSATSVLQAAAYDGETGANVQTDCDGALALFNLNNGDYVLYGDVDFGTIGTEAIEITLSSNLPQGYTGTLSVRLDSLSGPSIADITIGATGNECTVVTVTSVLENAPTGIHNVYFSFNSPYSTGVVHVYLFKFI